MNIKLEEYQIQNLIAFLDRVTITGLKEVQAMTEILAALQNKSEEKGMRLD